MEVVRLLAPNPGVFTGPGTNTYLVADGGEVLCIDPGPDDESHLEALLARITQLGTLRAILLTHSHPDHRPLAGRLARQTGARLLAHDPGDDGAEPIAGGAEVQVGAAVLRAVHTPGHAADHLCFHEERTRTLFSGDHVLGGSTTVIAPPDGDMRAYLESLRTVRALQPQLIHPGHGPDLPDAVAVIDGYIAHRLEREAQVLAAVRSRGEAAPTELVPELYAAYPVELWPLAALTVRAHLDKLTVDGAVRRLGDGDAARFAA